jgi:predicted small metal-binding protein
LEIISQPEREHVLTDRRLRLECHCGWNTEGDQDAVVRETQAHVLKVHWTEVDEADVLEMATEIP